MDTRCLSRTVVPFVVSAVTKCAAFDVVKSGRSPSFERKVTAYDTSRVKGVSRGVTATGPRLGRAWRTLERSVESVSGSVESETVCVAPAPTYDRSISWLCAKEKVAVSNTKGTAVRTIWIAGREGAVGETVEVAVIVCVGSVVWRVISSSVERVKSAPAADLISNETVEEGRVLGDVRENAGRVVAVSSSNMIADPSGDVDVILGVVNTGKVATCTLADVDAIPSFKCSKISLSPSSLTAVV